MPDALSAKDLKLALEQVVSDRYSAKPVFYWKGKPSALRDLLEAMPEVAEVSSWLDVDTLAEDVIPRRARQVLGDALRGWLRRALEEGRRLVVVGNPYLLLRYEPAAPLAAFWDAFVGSGRGVVVILPQPVPRLASLPDYVKFRAQDPEHLFVSAAEGGAVVSNTGGEAKQ